MNVVGGQGWPWLDWRGEEQLEICADDDQGRGRKAQED